MNDSPDRFLHGVLPVLQTPFTDRGEIDRAVLEREIDWAFDIGADGVVVAMVSEILRLGYSGRIQLAELVCQAVRGRGACVISVGAESTVEAIGFATHAEKHGASALMAIPPVATALGSAATQEYFAAIARSVSIPLIVQDASSYVGAAIDLSVYQNLLEQFGENRIYFKPEASPLGPNLSDFAMPLRERREFWKDRVASISWIVTVVELLEPCREWICSTASWLSGKPCRPVTTNVFISCRCRSVAWSRYNFRADWMDFWRSKSIC